MGYYAEQYQIQKIEELRQEWNDSKITNMLSGRKAWPEEAIIEKLKKEAQKWTR